jgi:hypothetical protein
MAPITTTETIAKIISDRCKLAGGALTTEQVQEILKPKFALLTASLEVAAETLQQLSKGEGDWRFSLGDGVTALVNFSGSPTKKHLEAFVKVFTVMANSYIETEEPKETLRGHE